MNELMNQLCEPCGRFMQLLSGLCRLLIVCYELDRFIREPEWVYHEPTSNICQNST